MHILVIGGNRFMGLGLVWRLLCAGHRVTLLNRGQAGDPFGDRVERLRADRASDDFDRALAGRTFDRVIDFIGFSADDAARAVRVLAGRAGHYIFISTGQVYLVREGCPTPAREADYAGPVMAAPPTAADHEDWAYGIGKRGAEDVLAGAPELPSTRLRIPMVNGELEHKRRLEAYVWRILDGGPLAIARGEAIARHVYAGAVVDLVLRLVAAPPPAGHAFNLAQAEQPTVRELVERIAHRLGARPALVDVTPDELAAAGLSARAASPFSSRWMSLIDPGRAVAELGFAHPPLATYLDSILAALFAAWPTTPPPGYEQRAGELAVLGRR
ncbi:MAG TPA: NAD-dependent epimerase/dehydratase family protein [Kofleriaceae bacterium]|nr:NAD-dependent epimerase/dehydratase family protein [Kofleriaceae bacterium]